MNLETVLFVGTFVALLNWGVAVVSIMFGHSINTPVPIFHKWGLEFTNTYVASSAIAFQAWFWFTKLGVL